MTPKTTMMIRYVICSRRGPTVTMKLRNCSRTCITRYYDYVFLSGCRRHSQSGISAHNYGPREVSSITNCHAGRL